MRRISKRCALALILVLPCGGLAGSKTDLPNDVSLELLGRSFLYSFTYQRTVEEYVGIEGGISVVSGSLFGGGSSSITDVTHYCIQLVELLSEFISSELV